MKLLIRFYFLLFVLSFTACNNNTQEQDNVIVQQKEKPVIPPPPANETASTGYDVQKGIGKFNSVTIAPQPDAKKAQIGKTIFESSCSSCHRLSEEAIGGPGLKDVTKKFSAEWIMNLLTNTAQMQELDPHLRKQAEFYQVKMPSLNLNEDQAMALYEYLRTADKGK